MVGKISAQFEINVPHQKLWTALNDPNLLAKALPGFVSSVEILEGDGHSAGSLRQLNFGSAVSHASFLKEKIESVDEESRTIVASIVEGGSVGTYFSSARTSVKVSAAGDESSVLAWEFEYEAIVEDPEPLEKAKDGALRTFKAVEAYLLSNAN